MYYDTAMWKVVNGKFVAQKTKQKNNHHIHTELNELQRKSVGSTFNKLQTTD